MPLSLMLPLSHAAAFDTPDMMLRRYLRCRRHYDEVY